MRQRSNQPLLPLRIEGTTQQFSGLDHRSIRKHGSVRIKIRGMGGATAKTPKNQDFQSFFRTLSGLHSS